MGTNKNLSATYHLQGENKSGATVSKPGNTVTVTYPAILVCGRRAQDTGWGWVLLRLLDEEKSTGAKQAAEKGRTEGEDRALSGLKPR